MKTRFEVDAILAAIKVLEPFLHRGYTLISTNPACDQVSNRELDDARRYLLDAIGSEVPNGPTD